MTAPTQDATTEEQEQRPGRHVTHVLCWLQAQARHYDQPWVTLCGKRRTRRSALRGDSVPCPLCHEVKAEHRASCRACIEHGWTA